MVRNWQKINDFAFRHYLILTGIIILGSILRFGNLDLKPLGIDEVITAVFSLGKSFDDIPTEVVFPVSLLQELLTLDPEISCQQIAGTVIAQSTHPPVFFCLMHQWLTWVAPLPVTEVWKLRSFPALLGVVTIAAVYYLNRLAFSRAAGLMGAAVMAVSPFGIYLSQEARHYTLPVLLITIALIGIVQIQKDLDRGRQRPLVWLSWIVVNTLSFYVHYFCLLAFIAQVAILAGLIYRSLRKHFFSYLALSLFPLVFFLTWAPILLEHITSPKTTWLPSPENIVPFVQILVAWLMMTIALPIENQPLTIQIFMGLLTLAFGVWLTIQICPGLRLMWRMSKTRRVTFTLCSFIALVLLQFLALVYLLKKDITVAPRYSFIYYPAICALLGASLVSQQRGNKSKKISFSKGEISHFSAMTKPSALCPLPSAFPPKENQEFSFLRRWRQKIYRSLAIVLFVGVISSIFVIFDCAFQKPYLPQLAASHFNQSPAPVMVVMGYNNSIGIALGLSYALALDEVRAKERQTLLAFWDNSDGYELIWQKLSNLSFSPLNLWVVAPGLKRVGYPQSLQVGKRSSCHQDPEQYYRVGIPYQFYLCQLQ
ncbi:MAG: glycosyltransferase family 39 protein [Prochloraceae cyanobacterium]